MSEKTDAKFPRMTDEEWVVAVDDVRDSSERYKDLDVGKCAEDGAREYLEAQEAKRRAEREHFKIPRAFVYLLFATLAWMALFAELVSSHVFIGWFLGANSVSAMFIPEAAGVHFARPISWVVGLLSGLDVPLMVQRATELVGGALGAVLVALTWGIAFIGFQSLMCTTFYGKVQNGMKGHHVTRTWLWNSVFVLSMLIPGYFEFANSVSGNDFFGGPGTSPVSYLIPLSVLLLVLWKQHCLNKRCTE